MKKVLFATLALALGASAALQAKTIDELRIYVNPGHGSWESNDRPMAIINHPDFTLADGTRDTLRFFESNTNLRKCFGFMEKLIEYGVPFDRTLNQDNANPARLGAALDMNNHIVFSHVKCGPYPTKGMPGYDAALVEAYNRSLSEISLEVDANNFDLFLSIHSNAATDGTTTNYPLVLFRGPDGDAQNPGSIELGQAIWPYAFSNKHGMWTYYSATNMNIRGDWTFYGSHTVGVNGADGYLGVLKHHAVGFLVEGYFHTYQPARHRAMNWDVCYQEGVAYARGFGDYLQINNETTGDIFGVVRDLHEKFSADCYKPNAATIDAYMPLNGVTVTLMKDGAEVATYTTDDQWNGCFVFTHLQPGTYTMQFSNDDYKALAEPMEVTVVAGQTVFPEPQLEAVAYEPPSVVYVNYPDPFNTPAVGLGTEVAFEQIYTDYEIEALAGKTIRRVINHGDYLYILGVDAEGAVTLIVFNPATKNVVTTVSTQGMDGTELNCSDIQVTSDGVLLACNKELTQYDAGQVQASDKRRGTFRIYKWENDENGLPTGDPICWLTSQHTGNWYRSYSGDTFCYTGTSIEGAALFSCETTGSSKNLRTMYMGVAAGEKVGESFHQPWYGGSANGFTVATIGPDYNFVTTVTPDDHYYIIGNGTMPVLECEYTHVTKSEVTAEMPAGFLPNTTAGASLFNYAGNAVLVAPDMVDGKVAGVALVNMQGGIKAPKNVGAVNGAIEAADAASAYAAGRAVAVTDDLGNVTNGWMELYLIRDNKLTLYTTKGVDQPVAPAAFAYGLKATADDAGDYTIEFNVNVDAPKAVLNLTTPAGEESTIELGAVEAGANTFSVAKAALPGVADIAWSITVYSDPVASAARIFDAGKDMSAYTRGGVKMIDDPNSDAYGTIVMSYGYAQGLETYDPQYNALGQYWVGDNHFVATNGSSTMRVGTWNGKAYVCDWSDGGAGYWVFDPANPTEVTNFLAGTRDSDGNYKYNGVSVGGGATDIQFWTEDGKTTMWVFCEDYPAGNGNTLISYEVTPETQVIDFAPVNHGFTALMANTNVALFPCSKGIFMAQTRGEGNDATGCPSFVLIDKAGEFQLFNSGKDEPVLNSSCGGFAISDDESRIVVANPTLGLSVFEALWGVDEYGDPELKMNYLYTIPDSKSRGYATEWTQLDFDPAGNLLGYERGKGLQVFALPNNAPVATTPAKAENTLNGGETGIEAIEFEAAEDGETIYYNLQGIRVDADNLIPGVYVKVAGQQATKIVVR